MSVAPTSKWGTRSRTERVLHDRNGEVFTTSDGDVIMADDPYSPVDTLSIVVYAENDADYVRLSTPLARHIRTLTNIFGYDTVKRVVDGMPEELRRNNE